jgi:PRC-barrel domain
MLFAVTGLIGCTVQASDGEVGAVKDLLFDDQTWKLRWVAVAAGDWLAGRRVVFIHPSAIAPLVLPPKPKLPMMSSGETLSLSLNLSRGQIEVGPHAHQDDPVTRDMEGLLYDYYGWDPYWGASHFGAAVSTDVESKIVEAAAQRGAQAKTPPLDGADHLHGVTAFKGYAVHAADGDIGHVENLLADDSNWAIRYLVIETRNWWPGKIVQLSPYAVKDIDWFGEHVNMTVTRDQVRSAPAWDPLAMTDKLSEDALHRHFGWPGYGASGNG